MIFTLLGFDRMQTECLIIQRQICQRKINSNHWHNVQLAPENLVKEGVKASRCKIGQLQTPQYNLLLIEQEQPEHTFPSFGKRVPEDKVCARHNFFHSSFLALNSFKQLKYKRFLRKHLIRFFEQICGELDGVENE